MAEPVGGELAVRLMATATEAAGAAWAPYSGLRVGAALLGASGRIYRACNVENASYGLSICAERAAVARAVAAGERRITAVAVAALGADGRPQAPCWPCGACRQVLAEFGADDTVVLSADSDGGILRRQLGDLLPDAFRLEVGASGPAVVAPPDGRWGHAVAPRPGTASPEGGWLAGTAAAIGDATATIWNLASADAARGLRETWLPGAAAGLAAAVAGALLGANLPAPVADPLSNAGGAAALAAPAVIALAAALAFVRAEAAGRDAGLRWRDLAVRGAAGWQIIALAALSALPRLLAALITGLALTLPATVGVSMASFFGRNATSGHILAVSALWAVVAAGILGLAAAGGAALPVLRGAQHFRARAAERAGPAQRLLADIVLLAAAGVLAADGFAFVRAGAGAGVPHFLLLPAARVGAAAGLLGAALFGGRLLALALGLWDRLQARRLPPGSVLLARAVARAAAPLRLCLLPALAVGCATFVIAGPLGVAATNRFVYRVGVGADARIAETFTTTCQPCADPVGIALPPIAAINQGAVGAGAAAAATLVPVDDEYQGGGLHLPVTLWGIVPGEYPQAVYWDGLAGGPAALGALAADPQGAVISTALAQETGLAVGDRLAMRAMPALKVVAIMPAWPGVGLGNVPWAVVQWASLALPVQSLGYYGTAGLQAFLLVRRAPGGSLATLGQGVHSTALSFFGAMQARGAGGSGLGRLTGALLPAVVAALALLWPALRTLTAAPEGFPEGDALLATGAAAAVATARRRLHLLVLWAGAVLGVVAGTVAAALFWPVLRIQPKAVVATGFFAPWSLLWLALGLFVLGLVVALGLAVLGRRPVGDALVIERVEAAAARSPEPPPVPEGPRRRAPRERPRVVHNPDGTAVLRSPLLAFAFLAVRRLRASWVRLLGLGAGILLAATVAATVPLFTAGSLTRVLATGLQPSNERPAGAVLVSYFPQAVTAGGQATIGRAPVTGFGATAPVDPTVLTKLAALTARAGPAMGLPATPVSSYLATDVMHTVPAGQEDNPYVEGVDLSLDAMAGLAQHARFDQGVPPAATAEADGTLDVAATDQTMADQKLQVGQVYSMDPGDGDDIRVRITGVFTQEDPQGTFWPYHYLNRDVFVDPGLLTKLAVTSTRLPLEEATWYSVLDLSSLTAETVPAAAGELANFGNSVSNAVAGAKIEASPLEALTAFAARQATLVSLLRLASVPVLALALYFVTITAGLIIEAESGEIAVYTSRGANALHILAMYLLEWVILAVPLAAVAPLPAAFFARAMGASSGFMRFAARLPLPVLVERRDFVYAAVAAGMGVVAALVPAAVAMGHSIISARLRSSRTVQQPLWQRAYLDGVALAALIFAWWVFRKVTLHGSEAQSITADPALYVLPSVFLGVCGLLSVRFLGWLMRSMDGGLNPWLRAQVVLPLRRIGRLPAQFAPVLLLLCFTAALGTYSAAAARTLDDNLQAAVQYRVGAQVRLVQDSPCTGMVPAVGVCANYPQQLPPFALNLQPKGVGVATQLLESTVSVDNGKGTSVPATLVLVDPSTFGQVATWDPTLAPLPEADYLSLLQRRADAALVSPDLAKLLGGVQGFNVDPPGYPGAAFTDVGTVPRWPGADVSGPMVVATVDGGGATLGMCQGADSLCPGSRIVLLNLNRGASLDTVLTDLQKEGLFASSQDVASTEEAAALGSPEWAGQTGLLSIGFLVALAVTITGYLLYAGLLLRGQLNQLGLLRALGLEWGQVIGAVALEQGILVVAGAAAGMAAGVVAAMLFLPLFRPAFTGADAPPFFSLGPGSAIWQVSLVLAVLFAVVIATLLALLRRMHVGETVKMEE